MAQARVLGREGIGAEKVAPLYKRPGARTLQFRDLHAEQHLVQFDGAAFGSGRGEHAVRGIEADDVRVADQVQEPRHVAGAASAIEDSGDPVRNVPPRQAGHQGDVGVAGGPDVLVVARAQPS